ncbi:enoyl-CoA hydratase [Novosphingobium fluoreni]|uniref:Enoyl-CoA hydratase n=1 Tax=Novosphingobium fluoreni TaxID=1391222 RepID=A0A7W6FYI2_9SPHN|nr:enoyl-CoA hydratase-related protein [Novosphingobium fluoreni]MBB3940323.1 enoyl-CoA hydratase [Novosphingobium fluoreni]
MTEVLLKQEPAEGVLMLTLNRPAARNAIDLGLLDALTNAFADFRDDARWRVAILTGTPPAFCAGLDLKTFSVPDAPRHLVTELITSIPHLGKPIIAAVSGSAFTGGLEMVLACDFAIAAEEARFADTHAKIGALSGSGMGSRLPHRVGTAWAKQMMLTCAPIDAATALRIGLVNEVMPAEALVSRAVTLATQIAAHDPELIATARGVVDDAANLTLAEATRIEQAALAKRKARGAMSWNTTL